MSQRIQNRRGTAAEWVSVNPVLAQGELGVETDTAQSKMGDGVTTWNSLAYWNPGGGGGSGGVASVNGHTGTVVLAASDVGAAPAASLTAEAASRANADTALSTAIGNEVTRATAAEGTVSAAVSTEATRAAAAEALLAPKASPALSGTPTVPTAAAGTNTTQAASTAFVQAAVPAALSPSGAAGGDLSGTYPNPSVAKSGGTAFGSAAFQPASAFDATGAAATAQGASLQKSANLSDLASAASARTSLGLGSAAVQASGAFDASGAAAAAAGSSLQKSANLSDLASASTARTNLGLGSAAVQAASAFDAAGAAAAAQSASDPSGTAAAAQAASLQKSANLSDVASASTARTSLGLGTAATQPSSAFDAAGAAAAAAAASLALPSGTAAAGQVPVATGTGTGTAWGTVSGGTAGTAKLTQMSVQTANFTVTANSTAPCDLSGGSFTATLPSAPANGTVASVFVSAVAGVGTNTLTVAAGGADVIDIPGGASSITMNVLHTSVLWVYNSGVWGKLAAAEPYTQVAASRGGTLYLDSYAGTDDQKMTLAVAAWSASGSGKIVLSPRAHTFANQWTTTYTAGVAQGLIIEGAGVAFNGTWGAPSAATVVTFTYAGSGAACIDMQHIGSIEIKGIQFKSANAGVPLFQTTNATPNIHGNVFSGGGSGTSCVTDAIVLGGTSLSTGGGDTAFYQGYKGEVSGNFFDGIRRIVLLDPAANDVYIGKNTVSTTCGSSLPFGAAFEIAGNAGLYVNGVSIIDNCIEVSNYPVAIKAAYAQMCTFGPNGFYDPNAVHQTGILLLAGAGLNRIRSGYHSDAYPFVTDMVGQSDIENLHQTTRSVSRQPRLFYSGGTPGAYYDSTGTTQRGYDQNGDYAALAPALDSAGAGGYASVSVVSGNATQVTDAATFLGSNWVTSVTAAFSAADQWLPLTTPGIPTGSYIQNVAGPATAWAWHSSYAYSLGDVARPVTANGHLYRVTTAGTSGTTAPAWPTGGGTVTDGTAVWTDLGTTATAALASSPSTSTGSGLTLKWGRPGNAQRTLVTFNRFHVITSSGGVPSTGMDAGAGTGTSGVSTTGSDHSFTANFTTGTGTAAGQAFHVALAQNAGTFRYGVTAGNAAAAALLAGGCWAPVVSNTVQVSFVNAPAASTAYVFNFVGMA